jgi:hypothetical protein
MRDFAGVVLKTNMVDLAAKAGSRMRRAGSEWRGNCPLHNGKDTNSFAVYNEAGKQKWKCFSHDCGQGDALDFVQAWLGFDRDAAYDYLGGERNIDPQEAMRLATIRAATVEKALAETIAQAQKALDELRAARSWLKYNANLDEVSRELWRERGIPDVWQDIWQLGFCPQFTVKTGSGLWTTSTLSIPIFDKSPEPINVRHRLLNPPTPTDKYRPDRPGLKASPFLCDPDIGFDCERILVIEGEIKSMVTYITLDDTELQVVGIPGKNYLKDLTDRLKGHQVTICLDPDAKEQAEAMAREVGGYVLHLRGKIDDVILESALDKWTLRKILTNARKP